MKPTNKFTLRRFYPFALAIALVATSGCKTVPQDSVSAFSSGINTTRAQSQEAFNAVNEMVADTSLDFAASQPHLLESRFAAGLHEERLQTWGQSPVKVETHSPRRQRLT